MSDSGNYAELAADFIQCETLPEKEEVLTRVEGIAIKYIDPCKRSPSAGTVLQHCKNRVHVFRSRIGCNVCVFKLGFTTNPLVRFQSYVSVNYSAMELLHVTTDKGSAEMLEAALIDSHCQIRGCRNDKPGGEGPGNLRAGHYYVYVVGARADQPKRIG